MWLLTKSTKKISSRNQIRIKEVRDGILLIPDNQYRLVLETSSVNFELKSEEEQDVIIDSFQNFLNSLPCQVQILIRIREVDVDHYVEQLIESQENEQEKIYKDQIKNYCTFVKNLVSGSKILSRRFYIVIPYHHQDKTNDFELIKEHIHLNRDIVMRGLEKLGMKASQLDSLALLDLFYSFYNPNQVKTQSLKGHTIQALIHHTYA